MLVQSAELSDTELHTCNNISLEPLRPQLSKWSGREVSAKTIM